MKRIMFAYLPTRLSCLNKGWMNGRHLMRTVSSLTTKVLAVRLCRHGPWPMFVLTQCTSCRDSSVVFPRVLQRTSVQPGPRKLQKRAFVTIIEKIVRHFSPGLALSTAQSLTFMSLDVEFMAGIATVTAESEQVGFCFCGRGVWSLVYTLQSSGAVRQSDDAERWRRVFGVSCVVCAVYWGLWAQGCVLWAL